MGDQSQPREPTEGSSPAEPAQKFEGSAKLSIKTKRTSMEQRRQPLEGRIRLVKLRQNESNSKLGFSLRGGKLSAWIDIVCLYLGRPRWGWSHEYYH